MCPVCVYTHLVLFVCVCVCVSTQHLERLESECSRFHSTHSEMGDEVQSVSQLQEQYLKFLDIIAVSVYVQYVCIHDQSLLKESVCVVAFSVVQGDMAFECVI